MEQKTDMCAQAAAILGGKAMQEGGVCTVSIQRKNMNVNIANHPIQDLKHMFHIQTPGGDGNALITGEMVLLENEVPKTVDRVSSAGMIVSAIHSHWLYDNPKLIYIHIETYTNPLNFAKMLAPILNDIT